MSATDVKVILFPVEIAKVTEEIVPFVAYRAEKFGALVHMLHVVPSTQHLSDLYQISKDMIISDMEVLNLARKRLAEFRNQFLPQARESVVTGEPADKILEYIDKNAVDMVVMGTHGRQGITEVVLGSVARRIVRRSPVPVLTVNPYLEKA
ncbi:MAG: universal stress protein [Desulfarculaceae bacterium]|jgi:nucleotide-binding universal stress UspA family protein